MRAQGIAVACAVALAGAASLFAQQQPADPLRTPGVQAGQDPKRAAFVMANCKTQPAEAAAQANPPARGGGPGGGPGGGAPPGRAGGAAPPVSTDYTVTAIPGVIEAGKRWRVLWTDTGNNADSPIGVDDGVLIAQND
jgi:hypothetical protein